MLPCDAVLPVEDTSYGFLKKICKYSFLIKVLNLNKLSQHPIPTSYHFLQCDTPFFTVQRASLWHMLMATVVLMSGTTDCYNRLMGGWSPTKFHKFYMTHSWQMFVLLYRELAAYRPCHWHTFRYTSPRRTCEHGFANSHTGCFGIRTFNYIEHLTYKFI